MADQWRIQTTEYYNLLTNELEPCRLTRRGFHKAALGKKNQGRMILLRTVTKQQTLSWKHTGEHTEDAEFI